MRNPNPNYVQRRTEAARGSPDDQLAHTITNGSPRLWAAQIAGWQLDGAGQGQVAAATKDRRGPRRQRPTRRPRARRGTPATRVCRHQDPHPRTRSVSRAATDSWIPGYSLTAGSRRPRAPQARPPWPGGRPEGPPCGSARRCQSCTQRERQRVRERQREREAYGYAAAPRVPEGLGVQRLGYQVIHLLDPRPRRLGAEAPLVLEPDPEVMPQPVARHHRRGRPVPAPAWKAFH
jgi:hypothetical protein